jgi:hypothetical protein
VSEERFEYSLETAIKDAERAAMDYEISASSGKDDLELLREKIDKENKLKRVKLMGDIRQSCKSVETRRLLWHILELGGPYRLSFVAGQPDVSALNEGRRSVAIEIMQLLFEADPGLYPQMQREHDSDIKSEIERKKKEREMGVQ